MSPKRERKMRRKRQWRRERAQIRRVRALVEQGVDVPAAGGPKIDILYRAVVLTPSWDARMELS